MQFHARCDNVIDYKLYFWIKFYIEIFRSQNYFPDYNKIFILFETEQWKIFLEIDWRSLNARFRTRKKKNWR